VVIDVPSGRVTATVCTAGGAVREVGFRNVPAYVLAEGITVDTGRGPVTADVSYGGAIYASVDASAVGLSVTPAHYTDLLALGREIKWKLNGTEWARHPSDPRLDGIYGTILFENLDRGSAGPHQRNVTVFADGEVDRSPCGSGTSARLALLASSGQLGPDQVLTHDSIVGTRFLGRVVERVETEGRPACVSEVRGMAHRTGEHHFVLEPGDPVGLGFTLR
jgi:proline racemase